MGGQNITIQRLRVAWEVSRAQSLRHIPFLDLADYIVRLNEVAPMVAQRRAREALRSYYCYMAEQETSGQRASKAMLSIFKQTREESIAIGRRIQEAQI